MGQLHTITGWWYTYPSEKYESQLGLLFPIYGQIKNDPNHQLDVFCSRFLDNRPQIFGQGAF
jgi:hypothetical protein